MWNEDNTQFRVRLAITAVIFRKVPAVATGTQDLLQVTIDKGRQLGFGQRTDFGGIHGAIFE